MSKILLDERMMEAAVYGGAVLGGGGGGWIEDGLQIGRLALEVGQPVLVSDDEMADDDLLVTVSLVGAPAAKDKFLKPIHYVRALELLSEKLKKPLSGIHTNENGAGTTVNGWFQAAVTGLPIVDLPCNGRAHPTGTMGSLNLHELPDYVSHQAAAGGKGERYVEMSISSTIEKAASMIRKVSVEAGGLVAVARNPVTVSYARANGAPGGIRQAIEVGEALLGNKGEAAIEAVCAKLGGRVVAEGEVRECSLETTGGFDVGRVIVGNTEMTFWNEYMTLEQDGKRLATFPDLIMTLDARTARPIVTAAIESGQAVAVIHVPADKLILSATMRNKGLLKPIEDVIGKEILPYL
ncbi:DUF917 family protein [Brevibacillus ruminantium]|uniref:DUF917 family protein n=1 Tax=Brevibacillus ruminantium TaxID=2950604 RepID=A0ABY4WLK7_9BACL|nr:DUF917 family protein [Brevibacillus ruminantium]USG65531.1 DUF917 family protein [Brevibacillus ruminantium]